MTSFVQQFQQSIQDGFINRPAVDVHNSQMTDTFVINAAVIDDAIVRVPTCVIMALTLEDQLAGLADAIMTINLCGMRPHELHSESAINQLCSAQDEVYVSSGTTVDGEKYVASCLFDGHGTDDCIRAIRTHNPPIGELMTTDLDTIMTVHGTLESLGHNISFHSGSTAAYARLSSTSVDCCSVGDSYLYVFVNGKLAWKSTPHTMANPAEVARHSGNRNVSTKADSYIKLLSEDRITQSPDGLRTIFAIGGVRLVPSMSLGHRNVTGIAPERFHLDVKPTDFVRVVGMSDGVHDMLYLDGFNDNRMLMTGSAEELVNLAHQRYSQEWTLVHAGRDYPKQRIGPTEWDDCSVFVLAH